MTGKVCDSLGSGQPGAEAWEEAEGRRRPWRLPAWFFRCAFSAPAGRRRWRELGCALLATVPAILAGDSKTGPTSLPTSVWVAAEQAQGTGRQQAPEGYRVRQALASPHCPARRPAGPAAGSPASPSTPAAAAWRRQPQEAQSPSQVRASLPEPRNSAAAMTSNMDQEMILADFQVKYWARLSSSQPRGFPVPGVASSSVCLSTAVLCGSGLIQYLAGCTAVLWTVGDYVGACVECVMYGVNVVYRRGCIVLGCLLLDCVLFPVLYECVEI